MLSMINVIIILLSPVCLGGQRSILIQASEEEGRIPPGLAEHERANAGTPLSNHDHFIA